MTDSADIAPEFAAALERLEALERGFNLFEAVGLQHQEIRHSHFLAYLLAADRPHGLEARFLDAFLAEVFAMQVEGERARTAVEVRREWESIDLMLIDRDAQRVFVVENKIGAAEHGDQLARYVEAVERAFPGYSHHYAYLSPDGASPSVERYRAVGYAAVDRALAQLLAGGISSPRVMLVVEDYRELLRRHVLPSSSDAKLCAAIWRDHGDALARLLDRTDTQEGGDAGPSLATRYPVALSLLVSHRPERRDLTAALALELRALAAETLEIDEAYTSGVYVAFRPRAWEGERARLVAMGWEVREYPLFFEFRVEPRALRFAVYIAGPVPELLRAAAFAWARQRPELFPELRRDLKKSATELFTTYIIDTADCDDPSWAAVVSKARAVFAELLRSRIPRIAEAASDVPWPRPSQPT